MDMNEISGFMAYLSEESKKLDLKDAMGFSKFLTMYFYKGQSLSVNTMKVLAEINGISEEEIQEISVYDVVIMMKETFLKNDEFRKKFLLMSSDFLKEVAESL